jgi:hypothetical protein
MVCFRHAVPEALGVETCDLVVLATMVAKDFASFGLECREGLRVCLDVKGVAFLSKTNKCIIVVNGIPSWFFQNDISKPVLCRSAAAWMNGEMPIPENS